MSCRQDAASGIFLDGKYIPVVANSEMKRLEFTLDSKHVVWAQAVSGRDAFRIFVGGKAVVGDDAEVATNSKEGWWDMAPDGSLSILAQDENNLKRIPIRPSAEPSVASFGGGGTTLAALSVTTILIEPHSPQFERARLC
jgi:hypothetical protein